MKNTVSILNEIVESRDRQPAGIYNRAEADTCVSSKTLEDLAGTLSCISTIQSLDPEFVEIVLEEEKRFHQEYTS